MNAADLGRHLDQIVPAAMERYRAPGVAIGVRAQGVEWSVGYGVTSVEHPLPVDAETLFQIGSITKTFLGTLVMRLVDAGQLDLNAPLRTYLPDLRLADSTATASATMTHLLTHTGGWEGDYFDATGDGDEALATYVARMADLPQLTPPGATFNYNNAGFSLAGRVIEAVTGQTFEAALRERLLAPLGMDRAVFVAADAITERVAIGHLVRDERPTVARPWALARSAHPAGGLATSVRDLLRYARFHLGNGTAADGVCLLQPATLVAMRTPRAVTTLAGGAVGLTWILSDLGGVQLVRHGGATNGQQASLLLVPARDAAIIVLTNSSRGSFLAEEVNRWLLDHLLGLSEPEPTPRTVPAERLAPYVGLYTKRLSDIRLDLVDGELVMQVIPHGGFPLPDSPPPPAPPPARLALYADDRVIVLDTYQRGARLEFLCDAAGQIVWLRSGVRLFAREP